MIRVESDGILEIAVGDSRKCITWKNQDWLWSKFLEKISTTFTTPENYATYIKSPKDRQAEIKDIGGFVGGVISGGRRKSRAIARRQMITLDIDFATKSFWEDLSTDFYLEFGCEVAMYSTHKHHPESPRLRLILPLDRPVMVDEYQAIARWIAGRIGIELFDTTTFQPERLMYWPSTSRGAEYLFEHLPGTWLSADAILAEYKDWHDVSQWPMSEKADKVVLELLAERKDPLFCTDKTIQAFNRAYSISEVIAAYLPDIYIESDDESRYTYADGTTSAGLVIYDDKFAFSHHSTDPAGGYLLNAFDLVRVHKFGKHDTKKSEDGKPITTKSTKMMYAVAFADDNYKIQKALDIEEESNAVDWEIPQEEETEEDKDITWKTKLAQDGKGYANSINNVALILKHDHRLKGRFYLDEFRQRKVIKKHLPWRLVDIDNSYVRDDDEANLRKFMENKYKITSATCIRDAFDTHFTTNSFHPIRNYLSSLKWDGRERLDAVFIDYMGAEDCDYMRAITRKCLVAAVARVFRPGIKFDYVVTLVGKQGVGKSTILKKLGGEWFSDSFGTVQGKEAYEQIQGVWLIEMGELAGLKKADIDTIKHFISKQEDSFRVAYGRQTTTFKRQCVFFGTTNDRTFLKGVEGDRRFWPVDTYETAPTKSVFTQLTQAVVDQIWAEAVERFKQKEPLFLSPALEKEALKRQEEHSEYDERTGDIEAFLNILLPDDWEDLNLTARRLYLADGVDTFQGKCQRNRVCAAEIWCELFGNSIKDMSRYNTKDIHTMMRRLKGWTEYKKDKMRMGIYGRQKVYVREGCGDKMGRPTQSYFSEN